MNKSDLIQKYLYHQLSPEELLIWNKWMDEDHDFRKDVQFHLELRQGIKQAVRKSLKERLQDVEEQRVERKLWPYLWKIAAVLLVGVGIFFILEPRGSDKQLYATYFEVYPNVVAPVVREAETPELAIQQAFDLYEQGYYHEAATSFEDLYRTQQLSYAPFYHGLSLMAMGDLDRGVEVLENPEWEAPARLQVQQKWYLALAYLKLDEQEIAQQYFQMVADADGFQAAEARDILEKISK